MKPIDLTRMFDLSFSGGRIKHLPQLYTTLRGRFMEVVRKHTYPETPWSGAEQWRSLWEMRWELQRRCGLEDAIRIWVFGE